MRFFDDSTTSKLLYQPMAIVIDDHMLVRVRVSVNIDRESFPES